MVVRYPCTCCNKPVRKNQKALVCTMCKKWVHITCGRVSKAKYDDRNEKFENWQCPKCLLSELPFYGFIDNTFTPNMEFIDNSPKGENAKTLKLNVENFPNERGMKISHVNIRSLKNKIIDVQQFLMENPYDIFSLSETWLKEDSNMNEIDSIPEYQFEGKPRKTKIGGGVGCYINNKVKYIRRNDLETDNLEIMWLEIIRNNSSSYFVGTLYRKPSTADISSFFNSLEENIDKVTSVSNNVILMGDFNCNMLTENSFSKKVIEFCNAMTMTQMIECPTRITPYSKTLIDLILLSDSVNVGGSSGVQTVGFSDHSLVYVVLKGKCHSAIPKVSKFRSFRSFDENAFKADLDKIAWTDIDTNNTSVDMLWNEFKTTFNELSDKHAPYVTVRRKAKGVPWITDEYIQLARDRDYFRKKFNQTKDSQYWEKYKYYRNKANNLNKRLKITYYKTNLGKCGNDVGKNWDILKKLLPSRNKKSASFMLTSNDEIITDDKIIAETLNKTFNDVCEILSKDLPTSINSVDSMDTLHEIGLEFKFNDISEEFVLIELQNLDVKKAVGVDGLNLRLLKLAAEFIAKPLTVLFNLSIHTGQVPDEFKIAKIIPIHKGGSYEPQNFRPISLLPAISKILEKAVHQQLYSYLNDNGILSERQSGFRPLHSTSTCLTEIVDFLLDNMNSKKLTGSIFLDLRKAFDVIPHDLLLKKMKYYGIRNSELEWFSRYLINRQQCVSIKGTTSALLEVKSGIPQGSILGPLIFCLYINDICKLPFHSNTKISLYADDTAIFNTDQNFTNIQNNLQKDFDLISNWLVINRMYLHPQKTKVMLFGQSRKLKNQRITIRFKDITLEKVDQMKYLGVILDSQLNWSLHISHVSNKISRSIGCIRRIKSYLTKKHLINLYYALVLSYIDYCCTAWGSCCISNLNKLQKLQNRYARLVLNRDYTSSQCSLLTALNWQSIEQRIKYQKCIVVYKIQNNLSPNYLKPISAPRSAPYNTRYAANSRLNIPFPRTEFKRRSFSYSANYLFNKLPIVVQNCHTLQSFKIQCRKYICIL